MPVLCLFYFYDIFQKIKYFYSATVFGNKKGKGEEGREKGEGRDKGREGRGREEWGKKRREGRIRGGKEMKR